MGGDGLADRLTVAWVAWDEHPSREGPTRRLLTAVETVAARLGVTVLALQEAVQAARRDDPGGPVRPAVVRALQGLLRAETGV